MKKITIIITLLLLLTSCTKNIKEDKEKEITNEQEPIIEEQKETYIDDNEIKPGLYLYQNSYTNRKLITTFKSPLTQFKDIASFEVFYTQDAEINSANQKQLFNEYKEKYTNNNNYKIGYNIKFTVNNEKEFDLNILKPSDNQEIFNYIQIYLYDDINTKDSFYSHLEDNNVTEDTLFTSIKLTASVYIDQITSPITLSAFTYDADDFDENGKYRGNSIYQITIEKSN